MPDLTGQYGGGYSAENPEPPEPMDIDAIMRVAVKEAGEERPVIAALIAELRKLREENARLTSRNVELAEWVSAFLSGRPLPAPPEVG